MKTTHMIGLLAVLGVAAYLFLKPKTAKASPGAVRQTQTELTYQQSLGDWNG